LKPVCEIAPEWSGNRRSGGEIHRQFKHAVVLDHLRFADLLQARRAVASGTLLA
jgi:hypothetical protein